MALSSSLQFSRSVVSDSLQPHELTAALQESLSITTPRASPNSCPLSRWCHPSVSASVIFFSSCNLVFPDVSNWLHFTPCTVYLQHFLHFLPSVPHVIPSPCFTDSGLLIPFWTGFSLGLLCAQLGSLDSLPTGLMFLIPGSHVYLSRGYPLSCSIIKQTGNLFFLLHLIFK